MVSKVNATKKALDEGSPGISMEKLLRFFCPLSDINLYFFDFFIFISAPMAFKKSSDVIGLKTGLKDFDKKIGGLHKSDLIIIAGRPSMGKTALGTNIAFNCAIKYQEEKEKVRMILNEIEAGCFQSVPDPYYGGENGFQDVYNLLEKACNKIVMQIE